MRASACLLVIVACGEVRATPIPPVPGDPVDAEDSEADGGSITESSADTVQTGDEARLDLGGADGTQCVECTMQIDSRQSGAFTIEGTDVFAFAELGGQSVYALGNYGAGRFIAAADSSLPMREQTDCPLLPWLAGAPDGPASILRLGWVDDDWPEYDEDPAAAIAGVHLPTEYIGDPKRLRADFDVVWYLEESWVLDQGDEPSDAEVQTLLDYTAIEGGGLVVAAEYADPGGTGYLRQSDLDSVNRILGPLGLTADLVSLDWGEATGAIAFPCFPQPG